MSALTVQPIRTEIFHTGDDLVAFVLNHLSGDLVREGMIVAVTSKIVSLAENCLVPRSEIAKADLVRREADVFLGEIGHGCFLTIKSGLFIPSAGIDESNSESGDYIVYPKDPFQSAERLWRALRDQWKLRRLGVLLTDSHTMPLRRGVTGISLSHWGFSGLRKMVGSKDIFGRELKMTNMNLADGLAASAVLMMGEGQERQPLAALYGAQVEFSDTTDVDEVRMPANEDLYSPFFKNFKL